MSITDRAGFISSRIPQSMAPLRLSKNLIVPDAGPTTTGQRGFEPPTTGSHIVQDPYVRSLRMQTPNLSNLHLSTGWATRADQGGRGHALPFLDDLGPDETVFDYAGADLSVAVTGTSQPAGVVLQKRPAPPAQALPKTRQAKKVGSQLIGELAANPVKGAACAGVRCFAQQSWSPG
ncbi:MAG: hypothetical protein ABGX10_10865 [Paracoccus sp. (in: a-proteobacteria)]|uniref:hypothetical protein n=1 Tax=Paracoccus sp. TaxID=267 RepID=UPI003242603C